MKSIILKTDKYILRTLDNSDATHNYLSWLRDPEINRTLDIDGEEQTLQSVADYIASHDNVTDFLFGIFTKESDKHIGNLSLRYHSKHKMAYLGLMIGDKKYWGKGVPLETRSKVVDWIFNELDCNKIEAGCYSINLPSIYNFQKQHWEMEGILKSHRIVDGKSVDLILYGMNKDIWHE